MGPGPQPGHRAQLSPEHLVKDTTACPSPQHHLLSPGPVSSERTVGGVPPPLCGQTCLLSCVSPSQACLFLQVSDSTSRLLFYFNTTLLEFSCFTTLC